MSEIPDSIQLFCQQPPNDETRWIANSSWFELVRENITAAIDRVLREPTVPNQDRFVLYELLCLNLLGRQFLYEAFWSSAYKQLFVDPQVGKDRARIALPDSAKENVLLTQEFDGEVTSVSDKQVIVRFKVADDLEERRFDVSELSTSKLLREGQAVRANCHLELIRPQAFTDQQIKDCEAQYSDLDEQLKKAQLKEDIEEDRGV